MLKKDLYGLKQPLDIGTPELITIFTIMDLINVLLRVHYTKCLCDKIS
jgi:hypothetical protein